jgi:hypothetical protein
MPSSADEGRRDILSRRVNYPSVSKKHQMSSLCCFNLRRRPRCWQTTSDLRTEGYNSALREPARQDWVATSGAATVVTHRSTEQA